MTCVNCTRNALAVFSGTSSTPVNLPALLLRPSSRRITNKRHSLGSSSRANSSYPRLSVATNEERKHLPVLQPSHTGFRTHSTSLKSVSNHPKTHSGSAVFASPRSSKYKDHQARSEGRANLKSDRARRSDGSKTGRRNLSYDRSFDRDTGVKTGVTRSRITGSQKEREIWRVQKSALSKKFGSAGWQPRKKLSPDALDGIRELHAEDPSTFDTATLAARFEISPEAIRRILKSKWRPNDEEDDERRARWERRGQQIWSSMSELGIKPPKKWRQGSKPVSEELSTVSAVKSDPIPLSERIL